MAKLERKTIGLFFLGGATIDERGRRGDLVTRPKDVEPWLRQMTETDIIADTAGVFVASGLTPTGLTEWTNCAEAIRDRRDDFDGYVVIHQLETMPAGAIVLSLMLQRLEKPVVLCGSPLLSPTERNAGLRKLKAPETGEYGAKATFINAVQVAVSDAAEVVMIYGSHIFRGSTVSGPITAAQGYILGKIDFGIRFFGEQVRRAKRGFTLQASFDRRVAVAEYVPGLDLGQVIEQAKNNHALFLSAGDGSAVVGSAVGQVARALPPTFPIIVFNPRSDKLTLPANVISVTGPNRTVGLMRLMWALGQTGDRRKLRKLLTA